MSNNPVQEKLIERNELISKVEIKNNELNKIKNDIQKLDNWLYSDCKHEWEYHRESSFEMSYYKCKICSCFQSDISKKENN